MATYTVIADEIKFTSGMFHSFNDCREFVENSKALQDVNKFIVIEEENGERKVHEYFKIVFNK